MLNFGEKKILALPEKEKKIFELLCCPKIILNEAKNHKPPPPPFKLHGRSISTCRFNRWQTMRAFCIFYFVLGSYFSSICS